MSSCNRLSKIVLHFALRCKYVSPICVLKLTDGINETNLLMILSTINEQRECIGKQIYTKNSLVLVK